MTKRSLRHPSRPQSGCMWSLMSIFDFRQGRSTTKLLVNRKHGAISTPLAHNSIGQSGSQKVIPGFAGKNDKTTDAEDDGPRASVKELMAVEMIKEQGLVSNDSEMKLERTGSKSKKSIKKQKQRNRSHVKSCDVDATDLDGSGWSHENVDGVPEQKLLNNLDLEATMEELVRISQINIENSNNNSDGAPHVEKLVAALKLVMRSREEGNSFCSEEFMDALRTLSLNKGLFLKLLRDQNSALVKHFQKLVDARADEDRKPNALPKHNESSSRKHWKIFRKNKSVESLDLDKDYLYPGRIVVLKPGPAIAQNPIRSLSVRSDDDKAHGNRNPSYFSFTNFKRKLWNAMGKERQVISPGGRTLKLSPQQQSRKSLPGWSSPNRNHFYTERFALLSTNLELVHNEKERSSDAPRLSRLGGSDIHNEAKKHLSDMLNRGDENMVSKHRQLSRSLGRIISFPEYNGRSRLRKHGNDIIITPEMRFYSLGTVKNNTNGLLQENLEYHTSLGKQNSECQPCSILGSNSTEKKWAPMKDDLNCSSDLLLLSEGKFHPSASASKIKEVAESRCWEEGNISSELSRNSFRADTREGETVEVENEESAPSSSLKSDSFEEVPILSPPAASHSHSSVDNAYQATDNNELLSPIFIVQPLFTDDEISPASAISQPVEKDIQPFHIQFEEQPSPTELGICTRISSEDEESAFEYVEAVLLGSGLNWDEFLTHWLSSHDILEPSLFNEVELFSSQPHHDQKLLFNCANEALQEVCEVYFGQFPSISNNKPNVRPIPKGMDLIQETWKRVERCMLWSLQRCSLEQLIGMDLGMSGSWMNLRQDVEVVGFAIGEAVLDELVEDFALSFVDKFVFEAGATEGPGLFRKYQIPTP